MSIDPVEIESAVSRFFAHFLGMHGWQKTFFTLAVILFGSGTAGKMATYFNQPQVTATTPASGSSINQTQPQSPEPSLTEKLSPWAMRVGGSLLVGFILGMALRVFIRFTVTILVVGGGILLLLSRFNVMNIDFTKTQTQYQNSIHWAQDQASKLKDVALAHVPSSGGGAFGVFAGFRKRRVSV